MFLAANPIGTTQLRLAEELRGIDTAVRMSAHRANFDIRQHWAVRVSDLQDALHRYRPHIVHFSGHGTPSSQIMLEDEIGGIRVVPSHALGKLFALFKDSVRCVVLNLCYSEQQGREFSKSIDCVVGMFRTVGDSAAVCFSTAFYSALGYGESVQNAFDNGCARIALENLNEEDTPRLIAFRGDPRGIRFATRTVGTVH